MNFFFLEDEPRYGRRVDHYFWSLNNPVLQDRLAELLSQGHYEVDALHCPVPALDLTFGDDGKCRPVLLERAIYDHWKVLGSVPEIARHMMSRPLPTTGLQALAFVAIRGYRDVSIVGMDFYQTRERYAYVVPSSVAARMDPKHLKPGYEAGAHSLQADIGFLATILRCFPRLRIHNVAKSPLLASVLDGTARIEVMYDNPSF
jgi:hypothetical protein